MVCSTWSHLPHTAVGPIERQRNTSVLSLGLVLGCLTRNSNQNPQMEMGSFLLRMDSYRNYLFHKRQRHKCTRDVCFQATHRSMRHHPRSEFRCLEMSNKRRHRLTLSDNLLTFRTLFGRRLQKWLYSMSHKVLCFSFHTMT